MKRTIDSVNFMLENDFPDGHSRQDALYAEKEALKLTIKHHALAV